MLLNDSPFIHLLGLRETRLSARFSDESLSVPHYTIIRRDAADRGHIGMAVYIRQSIKTFTKRRNDLESEKVECIWVILLKTGQNCDIGGKNSKCEFFNAIIWACYIYPPYTID